MKKFFIAITLAILCLSIVLSFTVNAQQADSWPMFHRDTAHTGYSTATGPSTNQTLWVFDTNGRVLTSHAVANGIVYFTSSDEGYFHTSNNHIDALNAKDGSRFWKYSVSAKIY